LVYYHLFGSIISEANANLLNTRSSNPHAKTPIPGKPSKLGLIGVWHKDNLYLSTSTIGNGNPHPMNIDSQTRNITMTPRSQLLFDKSFFSSLENQERRLSHQHTTSASKEVYWSKNCITLTCMVMSLFILTLNWNKPKRTLYVDLYETHLQLNPDNINKTLN
jgi:hypothetical protein